MPDHPASVEEVARGLREVGYLPGQSTALVSFQGGELAELQPDHGLGLGLGHAVVLVHADFALQGHEVIFSESSLQDRGGDGQRL